MGKTIERIFQENRNPTRELNALFFICAKVNFTLEKYISETQQSKFNHNGDIIMRLTNKKNSTKKLQMTANENPTVKLMITESFGDLPCNFYQNIQDEIFLTRKQIGQALEYTNPDDAIYRIHERHKERLDKFSVTAKLSSTDGKYYDTILYTERGIMEICRWSRQKKADLFMDWTWDIVSKYRKGELYSPDQKKIIEILITL